MKVETVGIIFVVLLLVANLGFSFYLFNGQGAINEEIKTLKAGIAAVREGLGETAQDIAVQEAVESVRKNSIAITLANYNGEFLEASYKLGSDVSSINRVFQDWGDHSQEPKVADIDFQVKGRALDLIFTPVVNPEDGSIVVVIQAESTSLDEEIQIETHFDLQNNKVTQTGKYTEEPL